MEARDFSRARLHETRAERNILDKKLASMGEKIKETVDKNMDLGQVKDDVDRDER